jgi:hypothetical protein
MTKRGSHLWKMCHVQKYVLALESVSNVVNLLLRPIVSSIYVHVGEKFKIFG